MQEELEQNLGYHFHNPKLLKQALTHSSVTSHIGNNYERLEFLGDRVLGVAVASALFNAFPHEAEGSLSPRHTRLVCKETVAAVARSLHLDRHINASSPEIKDNENVLCDVCEAVIGAIFIDGGCLRAIDFVNRHWHDLLHKDMTPPKDAKTRLQEIAHARGHTTPVYEFISRTGSEHEPTFQMCVKIDSLPPQSGEGHNKKLAEQEAAAKMIAFLESLK